MNYIVTLEKLEKLKSHFSKAPNRIYSKEKINEKTTILNKIIEEFNLINNENLDNENKIQKQKIILLITEIKSYLKKNTEALDIIMNKNEFLKLASATINSNFSGDPQKLNSFIDSIELLESMAETQELKILLTSFVKTRLENRARECITDSHNTTQLIKNELKNKIKPDNSDIVIGRMTALLKDNMQMQDFSKKAEELADAYRRALTSEGISDTIANVMTIKETVKMCRQSAKSDLVKSVLASTTFNNAKEVVAKFVTETSNVTSEKQILAYNSVNNNHKQKNYNNKKNYNGNNKKEYKNNNNYRHSNYKGKNFNPNFRNRTYNNKNFNKNINQVEQGNSVCTPGAAGGMQQIKQIQEILNQIVLEN